MVEGVKGSTALVLFLTQGVLQRPFCQLEIRTALKHNVPVVLLHETDPRHGGADFGFIEGEGLAFSANIANISKDLVHLTHWEIADLFRSSPVVPFMRGAGFAARTLPGVFSRLGCRVKKTGKARHCADVQRKTPPRQLSPPLFRLCTPAGPTSAD